MMKKRKLGIIGGSGLYKMEGFEKTKWKKIKTSWGKPSDEILIAKDIEASEKLTKQSNEITTRYRRIITEVNGTRDFGYISNFVSNQLFKGINTILSTSNNICTLINNGLHINIFNRLDSLIALKIF